jgi:ribosomal protein S10
MSLYTSRVVTVHTFAREAAIEAARSLPVTLPFDVTMLTTMQQAAMMLMHESQFSRTVYRRLLEHSKGQQPTLQTYRSLVDLGPA